MYATELAKLNTGEDYLNLLLTARLYALQMTRLLQIVFLGQWQVHVPIHVTIAESSVSNFAKLDN